MINGWLNHYSEKPVISGGIDHYKIEFYFNAPVKLNNTQAEIFEAIKKNPEITYDQMAYLIKKDKATVKRNIKFLKDHNRIERIGSDKTGHWKTL